MHWSLANDPGLSVRIAVAARNYWLVHGHLTEGFNWLKAASATGVAPTPAFRFKLLNGLGLAARFRGDYSTAAKLTKPALPPAARPTTSRVSRFAPRARPCRHAANDLASAHVHFDEGLAISRELGDRFGIAISLSFLGDLARTEGRDTDARPSFEEAVDLFRAVLKIRPHSATRSIISAPLHSDRR